MFSMSGWKLELNRGIFPSSDNLDGWYLKTTYSKAYFNDGLNLNSLNFIITYKELNNPLSINRKGERLELYDSAGYLRDWVTIGNMEGSEISECPLEWSISSAYGWQGEVFWYFDSSPTFNVQFDTVGIYGWIEGYVKDSTGTPVDSAKVVYDETGLFVMPQDIYVLTDSTGFYRFRNISRITYITVKKSGYRDSTFSVQIWPDSTVSVNFELHKTVTSVSDNSISLMNFNLSQNYPNPFNPETTIKYTINAGSKGSVPVSLKIYNILGEVVTILVNQNKTTGEYQVKFNGIVGGKTFPSGIYFYRLKAGGFFQTKKMILLR